MSTSFFDEIPAGAPPPGVQPNFTDPKTQGLLLIVLNAILISLMTIIICIRFYVRFFLTSIGWDDYTIAFAAILSWIQSGLLIRAVSLGWGAHLWDVRASTLLSTSNVSWLAAVPVVYPAVTGLIKVSILLLLYRIFTVSKTFRNIIIGSIVCITLVSIVYTVLHILAAVECDNLVAIDTNPLCGTGNNYMVLSLGGFAVLTDFWLLFLPMRSIFNLQLGRRRKIGVIAIFGTGAITCLVSLARVIYYSRTYSSTDPLWTAVPSSALMAVEVNVGIIVACSSTLGKFFRQAKASASSVYRSLRSKTLQHGSSAEKSKDLRLGSDDSSNTRPDITKVRNNSEASQSPLIGRKIESTYQVAGPIFRTDSYGVAYNRQG